MSLLYWGWHKFQSSQKVFRHPLLIDTNILWRWEKIKLFCYHFEVYILGCRNPCLSGQSMGSFLSNGYLVMAFENWDNYCYIHYLILFLRKKKLTMRSTYIKFVVHRTFGETIGLWQPFMPLIRMCLTVCHTLPKHQLI